MLFLLPSRRSRVWYGPNLRPSARGLVGTSSVIPPILLHLVGSHPPKCQAAHQDSAPVCEQLGTRTHLLRVLERLILYQTLLATPSLPSDPFTGYRSCNFSRIRMKTSQRPVSEALLLICSRDRRCLFAHGRAPRSRVLKLSERLVRNN